MRYVSVCSGIEAATVAWHPLGWTPVAFAETAAFPSAVLRERFPGVPNLGDMAAIDGRALRGRVDLLVGGTPCQSFSVQGNRRSLDDDRGRLTLAFVNLADDADPGFVLWENVPGVLSAKDNAFGCLLAGLAGEDEPLVPPGGRWTHAGHVLGPRRAVAWRVLDAQHFALAQRRQRVFLVACPRSGADPRAVLFESGGGRRDRPPGGGEREAAAAAPGGGAGGRRAVAFRTSANCGAWETGDRVDALTTGTDPTSHILVETGPDGRPAARRLTPEEWERLQGFPPGHTRVRWRGRDEAACPDGPRYRAVGNSMAVGVVRWIGRRIAAAAAAAERGEAA